MKHQELVEALKKPSFYNHAVEQVEYIQTHISSLFLTGEYVYKLKKPVDFGFLDFSTVELRGKNCQAEVELNRRLAPSIYLRTAPITLVAGQPVLDGTGAPIDWLVVMRQMDQRRLGPRVHAAGELTGELIDQVIDLLVPFYQQARTGPGVDEWGRIEAMRFTTDENFEQTAKHVGIAISQQQYDAIQAYTNRFYEQHAELFERRISAGFIRECHGDLHLGNIVFAEQPIIFDCIEFNPRLSCTDVAVDLAFLVMDLDFQGEQALAQRALDRYVRRSGDQELLQLIDFYACYRAYVRGKIACFTSDDPGLDEAARQEQIALAQRYFTLAHRYTGAAGHGVG